MSVVLCSLAIVFAVTVVTVWVFRTFGVASAIGISATLFAVFFVSPAYFVRSAVQEPREQVRLTDQEFVTSNSCDKCHPDHYQSWHRTYHRTMTQEPLPAAVLGAFDGQTVRLHGKDCKPYRMGDEFFMDLVSPGWEEAMTRLGAAKTDASNAPRIQYKVDRMVGSHHMQVYLSQLDNGAFIVLPMVWHRRENRWISRQGSFLRPETDLLYDDCGIWNNSCVYCHNTKPHPGYTRPVGPLAPGQKVWDTHLEEMGIACEACHGPGEAHTQANLNPFRRQTLQFLARPDHTIVNPPRLSQQMSAEVCGRCHGKWTVRREHWPRSLAHAGDFFLAGQPDQLHFYDIPQPSPVHEFKESVDGYYFWPDGSPRTTALEYQGMLATGCFQNGDMTCLSCHSMHKGDPNDQLIYADTFDTPTAVTNQACLQCHTSMADRIEEHTHHPALSQGSKCYNCHMPFTTYALLTSIRNHRISSPNVKHSVNTQMPNACTQCHVDRTLEWAASHLTDWYGQEGASLSEDQKRVPANSIDLLQGHALQRALAASRLGSEIAREAAPGNWPVPFLLQALDDSYPAVRLLAYQSLRKQPVFADAEFDYLGDSEVRRQQIASLRKLWQQSAPQKTSLTTQPPGESVDELIERLWRKQDQTEIHVVE